MVSIAFPHRGIPWSEKTRPERFLPDVSEDETLLGTEAGERIWRHVAWAFTEGRPERWLGLHQTVRMVLTAIDDVLHPEHMKTHLTDYSLELCVAALQGMNEPLYTLRTSSVERARTVLNLLPEHEAAGLKSPRLNHSRIWRRSVLRVIRRQREALGYSKGP